LALDYEYEQNLSNVSSIYDSYLNYAKNLSIESVLSYNKNNWENLTFGRKLRWMLYYWLGISPNSFDQSFVENYSDTSFSNISTSVDYNAYRFANIDPIDL
jgi:NRPS condensation-like uncharacterized protein